MEQLTGLGYGVITLGVLIGVGVILLQNLASNQASCASGYTYNSTGQLCTNGTNNLNPSSATQNINTVTGYLGTTSGGLASWIPLVIVLVIGLFFLGAFMVKRGKQA